jgi:dipeptidyl aminopeptidase/acylaminoacyl peptidase
MNTVRDHFTLILGIVLSIALALPAAGLAAKKDSKTPDLAYRPVSDVLISGSIPIQMPLFYKAGEISPNLDELMHGMPLIPGAEQPHAGRTFVAGANHPTSWQKTSLVNGTYILDKDSDGKRMRYMAFYLTGDRWQMAHLKIGTNKDLQVSLDGELVSLTEGKSEDGQKTHLGKLTLPHGKHLVTIKVISGPEPLQLGQIKLELAADPSTDNHSLRSSLTAEHAVDIQTVLDSPRISRVALSPDGDLVAITLSQYTDGENRETWLEVRQSKDGSVVQSWRGMGAPSSPTWHPTHKSALCWESSTDDKSTIWMYDFGAQSMTSVLEGVEKLGRWQWAPDGQSMIYSVSREAEPDSRRIKRVLHPADRQPWWRHRSHLMQAFIPGGFTRQLTSGPVSPGGWEISPDGSTLAFFMSTPDITHRPFSTSSLWLMDMETLVAEELLNDPWVGGATFSPDSKTLCLQGSPSAFDGLGRNLPEGVQANDYGGQLYLLEIDGGTPQPISIDLRPDVSGVSWSKADGKIYARCTDTQYHNIYRYKGDGKGWEKIGTGLDSVSGFQVAQNKKRAVAWGSSVSTPNQIYTIDTGKNRANLLLDPGSEQYKDVVFGDVSNWVASLPNGEQMDGFVFYPPDFDPEKTYPLIVYYYGGTSPITRDFGGRYPKNIWAGQGYVVYVPNPSGATGYGQEYAARHVNDWGIITAGEVIDGTQAFLAAHPFIDPDRVGCMGASYGGFLTEYILTRTDIFAAGVSHAGISSISSYWGEGMWGFGYGARALAHSYPWNNPDLYVDQSALFHADKITTPLLLVHGDSDINVPIGESDQLFTALKILGRDVEYVQIVGQDHHILDHEQRIIWNDTILAYLAKYLKGQEQWWDDMYPNPVDY